MPRSEAAPFDSALPWGIEMCRAWKIGQFGRRRLERNGSFQDQRAGSSTEYLDQRAFAQGDSVRHINWRVYGRTDQFMVKLFHHEAAPKLDLVLDVSDSMTWIPEKWELAARLWALFGALADKAGSQVAGYLVRGSALQPCRWQEPQTALDSLDGPGTGLDGLRRIPWQNQSLRVIISDLLFPGAPAPLLDTAARGSESTAWLVPECPQEAAPGHEGNIEFEDCESGVRATHQCDRTFWRRYRQRYDTHFRSWQLEQERRGGQLVRIPTDHPLEHSLARLLAPVAILDPA